MALVGGNMSFVDNIGFIERFDIIDEFDGLKKPSDINFLYILLKVRDKSGVFLKLTTEMVETAVSEKALVASNFFADKEYVIGVLDNNPNKEPFILNSVKGYYDLNVIKISKANLSADDLISIKLKGNTGEVVASTCIAGEFCSYIYLEK